MVARQWWKSLAETENLKEAELTAGQDEFVRRLTLERVLEEEQRLESQVFSTTLRDFSAQHKIVIERLRLQAAAGALDEDPLRKLVAAQQRIVLVTVNFDQTIEARVSAGNVQAFVSDTELGTFSAYLDEFKRNGGPLPLLKLHGDIEQPETIVANISQTTAGLSRARDSAILSLIGSLEPEAMRPWWYIGYSMRDRDLDITWRSPRFLNFQEHWVAPLLDPSVREFIELQRMYSWEQLGRKSSPMQKLISLTATDFFELFNDEVVARW